MPGTSKNFEGGSWAEVWLSCEHRSFFWLIIRSSEFNLPFFLILHPLIPWPLKWTKFQAITMYLMYGGHPVLSYPSLVREVPLLGQRQALVQSQHPHCPMASPWCEHLGLFPLLSDWDAFLGGWGWKKPLSWAPHTQTPNAESLYFLSGKGACWEISTPNPPRCWTHLLATKPWTPCILVQLTSSWYCLTLGHFDNPCVSLGRASRGGVILTKPRCPSHTYRHHPCRVSFLPLSLERYCRVLGPPFVNWSSLTSFSCLCCCSERGSRLGSQPPFASDNVDSVTTEL